MKPPGSVEVSLDAPGMTALHRVGVAGLWMTLDALDAQSDLGRPVKDAGGEWERTDRSVTLRWSGKPDEFFAALLAASFKLDDHGLVWFPALGRPTEYPAHAVLLQEALLNTFLQHGKTRGAGAPDTLAGSGDGEALPPLTYRPLAWYKHQQVAKDLRPEKEIPLAGWNFPGGAVRHSGFQDTALAEPLDRYLALLYAPVGAFFFRLRPRAQGLKPQFCLVLPAVQRLPRYARARRLFAQQAEGSYVAAGGAEASLHVALLLHSEQLREDIRVESLHAMEFGKVAWDNKQKYRLGLFDVSVDDPDVLEPFRRAIQALPPRRVEVDSGAFWSAPQVPDLVARNVVGERPWWRGFASFVDDATRRQVVFGFERKGLALMVQHANGLGDESAEVFVRACHEAWRRRLGMLGQRARDKGISFPDLVSREFEERRISFARCKNASTLRAAVTDFWARGGTPLAALQDGWRDVLPYLDERQWQAGRDLALLALASYQAQTPDEKKAIDQAADLAGAADTLEDENV